MKFICKYKGMRVRLTTNKGRQLEGVLDWWFDEKLNPLWKDNGAKEYAIYDEDSDCYEEVRPKDIIKVEVL